ncbi:hypothetical protein BDF19DRAFT_76391 [Syncephalis fuscata]|nr:hypothetical protein BDF19DRAFT_76391 [Syncephalis fuscata]
MGAKQSKSRYPKDYSHLATRRYDRSSQLSVLLTTPQGSATQPLQLSLADNVQLPPEDDNKAKKESRANSSLHKFRRFGWCMWDIHDVPKQRQSGKTRHWRRTAPPGFQRGWEFMLGVSITNNQSQAERDCYLRITNWVADVIEAGAVGSSAGSVGVEDFDVLPENSLEQVDTDYNNADYNTNEDKQYYLNGGQGFDASEWPIATDEKVLARLSMSKEAMVPLDCAISVPSSPSSPSPSSLVPAPVITATENFALEQPVLELSSSSFNVSNLPSPELPLLSSLTPQSNEPSLELDTSATVIPATNDAEDKLTNKARANYMRDLDERPVTWVGPLPPARHIRRSISGTSGLDKHRLCKSWAPPSDRIRDQQQLATSLIAWQFTSAIAASNGSQVPSTSQTTSFTYAHDRNLSSPTTFDSFNTRDLTLYNDSLIVNENNSATLNMNHTDAIYGRRRAASMSVATGIRSQEFAAYSMSGLSYSLHHLYQHHYPDGRMSLLLPEDKLTDTNAATGPSVVSPSTPTSVISNPYESGHYLLTSTRSPTIMNNKRVSLNSSNHRYSTITVTEEEEEEQTKEEAEAVEQVDGHGHLLEQPIFDASIFGRTSDTINRVETDNNDASNEVNALQAAEMSVPALELTVNSRWGYDWSDIEDEDCNLVQRPRSLTGLGPPLRNSFGRKRIYSLNEGLVSFPNKIIPRD